MQRSLSLKTVTPHLIALIAIAAGLVSLVQPASAQTPGSQNITMSPASTQISVAPGETATKSFDIINGGDTSYKVKTSVMPYSVQGIDYDPLFVQLPGTARPADWVQLQNTSLVVGAQKVVNFPYTISVPEGTAAGGYYVVLFAETDPTTNTTTTGVTPRNRVGNILYITVTGDVVTGGDIAGEPLGGFLTQAIVPIGIKIKNTGGVHYISKIKFTATDMNGRQVYSGDFERFILPQTERRIAVDWTPSVPIGLYTISRSATVAGEIQTLPDKQVLHIQPWLFGAMGLALVLISLLVATRIAMKRYKK